MPEWIHNRANHIRAKNPSMPESESWAIATQQAHATGESPKGYGTAQGRHEAHEKYKTPGDDKKTADPGGVGKKLEKDASLFRAIAPAIAQDQDDRMRQIIREELQANNPHHPQHHHSQQPSIKAKIATPFPLALIDGFSDEIQKIKNANITMNSVAPKPTVPSQLTSRVSRNTLSLSKTPTYSNINTQASTPGPAQTAQPMLGPPPVNG